ncbi:DUF998 domain-containing protein [Agreia pratensis]|uniref:DUF998 domain-containing protein n=1 Tax=Agreia pratensis TaxID=150121 RepID=UPI00188C6296|nr:DUF998 domain-containing protein [Agreia pratensis]MBF4633399.1 DUF998 domain-containing protein [Agreia pratensis]
MAPPRGSLLTHDTTAAPTQSGRPSPFLRVAAWAGMALVGAYVVIDVVLQLLPPHYSPIADAESNLAVGPFGWLMNLNFLGRAAMTFCVLIVVARIGPVLATRRIGSAFLGLAGLCSAALVFFPTDVNGPGEFGIAPTTLVGTVHVAFATTGFMLALVAMVLLSHWMRRAPEMLGLRRPATVFLVLAVVGLVSLAISIAVAPAVLGATERICLLGILGWAFVVCIGGVATTQEK